MSFASLQQQFVPLHHALAHESYSTALSSCDDLLSQLHSLQAAISSHPSAPPSSLSSQSQRLLSSINSAKASHTKAFKQLHTRTQAFGRSLERCLSSSVDVSGLSGVQFDCELVDEEVGRTLEREGLVDIARELKRECGGAWEVDDSMLRMYEVKRRMEEERDVSPCLDWVKEEEARMKERLESIRSSKRKADDDDKKVSSTKKEPSSSSSAERMEEDDDERVGLASAIFPSSPSGDGGKALAAQAAVAQSLYDELHSLHFDLHRIRFLQLLTASSAAASSSMEATASSPGSPTTNGQHALLYAQTHFGLFANDRIDDIRKLSGLLLFYPNLTTSPYANILTPPGSPTATSVSSSSASSPSALSSHLAAACASFCSLYLRMRSLPPQAPLLTLLQAASVSYPQIAHYQSIPMSSSTSLELDLHNLFPFHSTFICPVTREPSTGTNEPVMLQCGHLISAAAMDKIVRGLRMTRKFKCPTCPREQTPQDVLTIKL